jgi:hypothetical protein
MRSIADAWALRPDACGTGGRGALRCVLAIELSKKSWIVAVTTPSPDNISRHMLKPCDGRELLDLCERIRNAARRSKGRIQQITIVAEPKGIGCKANAMANEAVSPGLTVK